VDPSLVQLVFDVMPFCLPSWSFHLDSSESVLGLHLSCMGCVIMVCTAYPNFMLSYFHYTLAKLHSYYSGFFYSDSDGLV
jgi:hypothetical protein